MGQNWEGQFIIHIIELMNDLLGNIVTILRLSDHEAIPYVVHPPVL